MWSAARDVAVVIVLVAVALLAVVVFVRPEQRDATLKYECLAEGGQWVLQSARYNRYHCVYP